MEFRDAEAAILVVGKALQENFAALDAIEQEARQRLGSRASDQQIENEMRRIAAERTVARLITPKHLSAVEILPLVQPLLTPDLGAAAISGPIDPDSSSGPSAHRPALLVVDFPEVLTHVEAMLQELDQPPPQFEIEAVITTSDACTVTDTGLVSSPATVSGATTAGARSLLATAIVLTAEPLSALAAVKETV